MGPRRCKAFAEWQTGVVLHGRLVDEPLHFLQPQLRWCPFLEVAVLNDRVPNVWITRGFCDECASAHTIKKECCRCVQCQALVSAWKAAGGCSVAETYVRLTSLWDAEEVGLITDECPTTVVETSTDLVGEHDGVMRGALVPGVVLCKACGAWRYSTWSYGKRITEPCSCPFLLD